MIGVTCLFELLSVDTELVLEYILALEGFVELMYNFGGPATLALGYYVFLLIPSLVVENLELFDAHLRLEVEVSELVLVAEGLELGSETIGFHFESATSVNNIDFLCNAHSRVGLFRGYSSTSGRGYAIHVGLVSVELR
jgi:hypothetical protein